MEVAEISKRVDIAVRGCAFLIEPADPAAVVIPEEFSEEHRMIADLIEEFIEKEISGREAQLEKAFLTESPKLIRKAGAIGALGIDVPEEYGGVGLGIVSSAIASPCKLPHPAPEVRVTYVSPVLVGLGPNGGPPSNQ